jgi:flagellar biosynthesis protein FliR
MPIEAIVANSQLFLLVFARIFALLQVAPLLSSSAVPSLARVGFCLFVAAIVFPWVLDAGYPIPDTAGAYFLLLLGEALVGILLGFVLSIIYSTFLVAGQFFSFQMGFGASQVFDPLAQIQIPLIGQFLNIVAMFILVSTGGFRRILLVGVLRSFERIRPYDLIAMNQGIADTLVRTLGGLFEQAMVISFPILGTLLLISVGMGLLAKAAPQMNLLMLGFPIKIGVAFVVLLLAIPFLMELFAGLIDSSFDLVLTLIDDAAAGAGGVR